MFLCQKTIQYLLIPWTWIKNYAIVFDKQNSNLVFETIGKFSGKPFPQAEQHQPPSRHINNSLSVYLFLEFEL